MLLGAITTNDRTYVKTCCGLLFVMLRILERSPKKGGVGVEMLVRNVAALEKLTDVDALWDGVVAALHAEGFNHAIYLTVDARFENPHLRCTLPEIYRDSRPEDDPFLRYVCDSYDILPVGAAFADDHPYLEERERAFIDGAAAAGIISALALPMRLRDRERFGGFIVGSPLDRAAFTKRILPRAEEVRLFCLLIHRRIEELMGREAQPSPLDFREPLLAPGLPDAFDVLSPREREVIYLLAQGRSRLQAADLCGISVHTVSDYAKSGYRKLGVSNRAQVAAMMLRKTG